MTRTARRQTAALAAGWGWRFTAGLAAWLCSAAVLAEAPRAGDTLAARFPAPPVRYATPAFAAGRSDFTRNEEVLAAIDAAVASGRAHRIEAGHSASGLPIAALHFSRGERRPVALLVGQQHGNEPAGGEAMLAVAAALADPKAPLAGVLERIDVVVLPRANPEGALLARRGNGQGVDVNRDHLRLESPEARAIAMLARRFEPLLVVDAHEHLAAASSRAEQGTLARHDLLVQLAGTANLHPLLAQFGEAHFRRPLWAALAAAGLSVDWYHTGSGGGFAMGGVEPHLARNAYGLRHAVSVLLESRGMELGRLHFERRVHAHVVAVSSLLRSAAAQAEALAALQVQAGREVAALACAGPMVVDAATTPGRRELTLLDARTGAERTLTVDWASAHELQVRTLRERPCGYWLAPGADKVVQRLRELGLVVRSLEADTPLQVERYRETSRGAAGPGDMPLRLTVELESGPLAAPPGSHYLALDQALAHLAVAALEPDTAFSLVARRLLGLADLARVMKPP